MKSKILRLFAGITLIIFSQITFTGCDKACEECYFEGRDCDIEKVPQRIDIDKVVVTKFPPLNGSDTWDPTLGTTFPDLKIQVYEECSTGWCSIFESAPIIEAGNSSHTFQLPATSLNKPLENYRVSLYDYDLSGDDLISGKTFTPYTNGEKFPNPIKISTEKVDFEIHVKYYFDSGCVKID